MNRLYFIGGISCAGKSTRVLALKIFLDRCVIKSEPFTYTNVYGQTKQIGYLYANKLLIIGKYIERNNKPSWQGLDSFTNFLAEDYGQANLYEHLFEWVKQYSIIVEASLLVRSPWSRPLCIEQYTENVEVFSWMFCARSIDEYKERLAIRSDRKVTEQSGMWKSNNSFKNHIKHFDEEKAIAKHPDLFHSYLCSINEPVYLIGDCVLTQEKFAEPRAFIDFCKENEQELHTVGAIHD